MEEPKANKIDRRRGFRLVHIVLLETLLIAIVGFAIWGVAWDIGFPTVGLVGPS